MALSIAAITKATVDAPELVDHTSNYANLQRAGTTNLVLQALRMQQNQRVCRTCLSYAAWAGITIARDDDGLLSFALPLHCLRY